MIWIERDFTGSLKRTAASPNAQTDPPRKAHRSAVRLRLVRCQRIAITETRVPKPTNIPISINKVVGVSKVTMDHLRPRRVRPTSRRAARPFEGSTAQRPSVHPVSDRYFDFETQRRRPMSIRRPEGTGPGTGCVPNGIVPK